MRHRAKQSEATPSLEDSRVAWLSKKILEFWGADAAAQRFNPPQETNAHNQPKNSYVAFEVFPLVCPEKGEFGIMMIGILVVTFSHQVFSEYQHLKLGGRSQDVFSATLTKAKWEAASHV